MADKEVLEAIKEIRDDQVKNGLVLQRISDVVLGITGSTLSIPARLDKIEVFEAKEHTVFKMLLVFGGVVSSVVTSWIAGLFGR